MSEYEFEDASDVCESMGDMNAVIQQQIAVHNVKSKLDAFEANRVKAISSTLKLNQMFSSTAAFNILKNDFLKLSDVKDSFTIEAVDDSVYHWRISFPCSKLSKGTPLRRSFMSIPDGFGDLVFDVYFQPDLHPFYPPKVQLHSPRLKMKSSSDVLATVLSSHPEYEAFMQSDFAVQFLLAFHPDFWMDRWSGFEEIDEGVILTAVRFMEKHFVIAGVGEDGTGDDCGYMASEAQTYSPLERAVAQLPFASVNPACQAFYEAAGIDMTILDREAQKKKQEKQKGEKKSVWGSGVGYSSGTDSGEVWNPEIQRAREQARDESRTHMLGDFASLLCEELDGLKKNVSAVATHVLAALGASGCDVEEDAEATLSDLSVWAAKVTDACKLSANLTLKAKDVPALSRDLVSFLKDDSASAYLTDLQETTQTLRASLKNILLAATSLRFTDVGEMAVQECRASLTAVSARKSFFLALGCFIGSISMLRPMAEDIIIPLAKALNLLATEGPLSSPEVPVAVLAGEGLTGMGSIYKEDALRDSLNNVASEAELFLKTARLILEKAAPTAMVRTASEEAVSDLRALKKLVAALQAAGAQLLQADLMRGVVDVLQGLEITKEPLPAPEEEDDILRFRSVDEQDAVALVMLTTLFKGAVKALSGDQTEDEGMDSASSGLPLSVDLVQGPEPQVVMGVKTFLSEASAQDYLTSWKQQAVEISSEPMEAHHYRAHSQEVMTRALMSRISKEIASLGNQLEPNLSSAVAIRVSEQDTRLWRVLITGPQDTPYALGCFVFDLSFPYNYPAAPPKVNLRTTGGGKVRFNPNLYNCGKVCLSLLGTWAGGKGEAWDPQVSSVYQLLVSIQALILVEDPYYNEPGHQFTSSTVHSQQYNERLYPSTATYAMLHAYRDAPAELKPLVKEHLVRRQADIDYTVRKLWKLPSEADSIKQMIEDLKKDVPVTKVSAAAAADEVANA